MRIEKKPYKLRFFLQDSMIWIQHKIHFMLENSL